MLALNFSCSCELSEIKKIYIFIFKLKHSHILSGKDVSHSKKQKLYVKVKEIFS